MIRLTDVFKRYGEGSPPAVRGVTLSVPEGSTVALIGPSGCGKTTLLRMINRLIEPTSGRIEIDGEDISAADPSELRRRIGYVIQQVGLFPHMTVAENIGAVPSLLGWSRARIAERVEELFETIGLDAREFGSRYPKQLSGGQQQRVGVARALAADPPVLLMDEPFGAIDPIARTKLQEELTHVLSKVRKTVVVVTHDLDEAIKLGDRVAILKAGELIQYDTPEAILSKPANDFVEDFVGADRAVRRLSLFRVVDVMSQNSIENSGRPITANSNLREALSRMISDGVEELAVNVDGAIRGSISKRQIMKV
ncbi:ABC transporter ATP-binding protein [Rhizobium calliandrae]|uniref:Quaternary amine transport ATP-binding protein n=2 Tax=Rhizobium TaxID=379 RepID=A0A387FRD1_9HYPH|nr:MULTISPECIES: ABC transporter ATP-binding protein [Rhizobium]AYG59965.1 ABC transporter ATP-binding protein [Rhizobium jaguaris]MDL2406934.1 ABC transporter ATP-binding protein [Rhizobium calliandrae]